MSDGRRVANSAGGGGGRRMSLLQLGMELDGLELDEAEEMQLSVPAREAVAAARMLRGSGATVSGAAAVGTP